MLDAINIITHTYPPMNQLFNLQVRLATTHEDYMKQRKSRFRQEEKSTEKDELFHSNSVHCIEKKQGKTLLGGLH